MGILSQAQPNDSAHKQTYNLSHLLLKIKGVRVTLNHSSVPLYSRLNKTHKQTYGHLF